MIVDAHVHLALYEGNAESLEGSREALLAEMDQRGVDCAVVIPDNTDDDPNIAGLETARTLLGESDRFALLGSPDVLGGEAAAVRRFERLLENRTIRGLKFFPGHEPYYPTDIRCFPYYAACQAQRVPVVFHTGENPGDPDCAKYNDPKYIAEVAEKYPSPRVIITHYFWPKLNYCYEVTKGTPNIYFELAGTDDDEVVQASGGIDVVKEILRRTVRDRPNQVMFGSDWPMCSVRAHLDLVNVLGLDDTTRGKVLGQNAVEIYKLSG